MADTLRSPISDVEVRVRRTGVRRDQLYPAIRNIVRIENRVREPFSARCLAKHMPSTYLPWLKSYLSSNAATSLRDREAYFVRVFRGWYRLNDT
ncbi:hypothetical protein Brsp06_04793 [Brucella sp. NBRC 13694]|jgi:hypothetical protein|nr:hypothetical protein [Brucella anthropi]